jgi:predicted RND superfamily exporter protein
MGLGVLAVVTVFLWVDLSPRVESDFFFSRDDPQLRALLEMDRRFPAPEQVLLRIEGPDIEADSYVSRVGDLTAQLEQVPGVASVSGIATEDVRSPLWRRLLLNEGTSTSNIIVSVPDPDPAELVPGIEAVVLQYDAPDFEIEVSGVPYIVELIRRNLFRDLVVFSSAAFVVFGLLVGLVYRDRHVVFGTLTTCLMACAVTLCVTHLLHVGIGLLTANIAVIVFVLTLSHIVFLTSNWKRATADPGTSGDPADQAVTQTIGPSFWCMLTTMLGFLSLLLASAKPLRELGFAGAIGTLTALVVAYGVYPTFLRSVVVASEESAVAKLDSTGLGTLLPTAHGGRWLAAIAVVVLAAGAGLRHLSTDPTLLSYFAPGSDLRDGLEAIDRDGGSSPLDIAVRDPEGDAIHTDAMNDKMWVLQERLENDSSVGVTISPAVLLAHAKTVPFGAFLSWSRLLDILESPFVDRVGLSFVTPDREQARFFLRMREAERAEPRAEVVARVSRHVEESGLEVALLAGHYELQGQLGQLISSSLRIGLGGLLLLFIGIAFAVSRSIRLTVAMFLCLLGIPALVLGTAGHLRMPIDIITSPAANVALAMGVDSMIHLAMRVRRLAGGTFGWSTWLEARAQLWRPILGATLIICAGFGIFSLSSFPPTQRFGFAVILGTLTAATMALVALPFAATVRRPSARS